MNLRKTISIILTITITGLLSCIDDSIQQSESVHKEDILNYLVELKSSPE